MIAATKGNGKAMSIPGGLAVGGVISILLTLGLSALVAWLVNTEALAPDKIGYGSMIILLLASFLGAMTAQGKVKHRRGLVCVLAGIVYYLLLLSITALFFGGQYTGMGVTGLVVLSGSGCGALLVSRQGRGGRKRRFRTHK